MLLTCGNILKSLIRQGKTLIELYLLKVHNKQIVLKYNNCHIGLGLMSLHKP